MVWEYVSCRKWCPEPESNLVLSYCLYLYYSKTFDLLGHLLGHKLNA